MTRSVLAKPDFHTAPEYDRTLGDEVADLGGMVGFAPYPEQRVVLDDIFALDPKRPNRSAVFEQGIIAPRQQLKTGAIKLCALGWLFITDQPLVIWSAHEFGTAQEAFRDMQALIDSSDYLTRRVHRITTASGNEAIELTTGARLKFKARTSGGGRGLTGSKVILDEAFALMPEHMGALLPTLIAVDDPQVVYGSSAGMARSAILRDLRDRGRVGGDRLGYVEYLAPRHDCEQDTCQHRAGTPGCAMDDIELWRQACVTTARRDPTMEPIKALRNALPPEEFARECLGWWDDPEGESPIDAELWRGMTDADSSAPVPVFALDVSPARDWSCIVAAGRQPLGDKIHVEVTGRGDLDDYRPGTGWVRDRLAEMKRSLEVMDIHIATGSAAESLVPDLERDGHHITRVPATEVSAACGLFYDLAIGRQLAHVGQQVLQLAVPAARKRAIGDKAFVWTRKSPIDISPMYAATIAVWAAAGQTGFNVW